MINRLMTTLLDELRIEGLADPLAEAFTLAALWDDLSRLAGETPPPAVRRHVEDGSPIGNRAACGPPLASSPAVTIAAPPNR